MEIFNMRLIILIFIEQYSSIKTAFISMQALH